MAERWDSRARLTFIYNLAAPHPADVGIPLNVAFYKRKKLVLKKETPWDLKKYEKEKVVSIWQDLWGSSAC